MENKKSLLQEVVLLRPLAILLVCVYHAFIIFRGNWALPEGVVDVPCYRWIADFSYSFMLQLFVLLSGYVFAFQIIEKGRDCSFSALVISKGKRLLIPGIIFSALYICLFGPRGWDIIWFLLNGAGHLWFLPMLFWCFVFTWLLLKTPIKDELKIGVCVLFYFGSIINIPFGISEAFNYLLFFYLGFFLKKVKIDQREDKCLKKHSWLWGLVYIVSFIFFTCVFHKDAIENRLIHYAVYKSGILIYSLSGSVALMYLSLYVLHFLKVPAWIGKLNPYCFGIYICQQFILQLLYYHTIMPRLLHSYALPWVALILTLFISFALSYLMRRFKVGRFLIG